MHIHEDHMGGCGGNCQSCASQCEHTPMEELQALMKFMVTQNAAHVRQLSNLAAELQKAGNPAAFTQVLAAISDFEKGNMRLSVVLNSLEAE